MRHTDELAAALHAAEQELDQLDVSALLLVTEIGDHGIQIVISENTDPSVVRHALRGAADALDGNVRPVLDDVMSALRSRGWKHEGGVWRHKDAGRPWYSIGDVLLAQTAMEIGREVNVREATIE